MPENTIQIMPVRELAPSRGGLSIAGISLSVLLHVGIIGLAWLASRDTGPKVDLTTKPIQAHLLKLGEHRDEKLLPRKEANLPPPPPDPVTVPDRPTPTVSQPIQPKPLTPAPPVKRPKDTKKDLFAAFDRSKPVQKADVVAGSANGSVDGDSLTATEGEQYFGLIQAKIRRGYDVASTIPDAERVHLKAVVVIWIDRDGTVTKTDFQDKSGNALFDSAVMSAVQKASPFPPPPDGLRQSLSSAGVALQFRP